MRGATQKMTVPNGTNIDFRDKLELVDAAVEHIAGFMHEHLVS